MKRFFIIIFIIVILFGIDIIINSDRVKLDGKIAEIQTLFFTSDTKYSEKYTHEKFNEIKIGMSEKEVVNILGEPISKFKPHKDSRNIKLINHVAYQYSYSPSSSHFRVRNVIFDQGKVIEIIHCFDIIS